MTSTSTAVVLGTSFVSGAFILTASLSKAFDDIVEGNYNGVDVVLTGTPDDSSSLRTCRPSAIAWDCQPE